MTNVKKINIAPLLPAIDYVISELNKAVSTDDLILLVLGLEWVENMSYSSLEYTQ